MMKDIRIFGSLNCDLTIRAPYLPKAGETLKGSDFLINAGGKGANQAYACAKLGGDVSMAGCVGQDAFGEMLLQNLSSAGVDTRFIRKTGRSTGVAMITIIDGDNRIILDEGANACVSEEDVYALLDGAKEGDILLVQLENPLPVIQKALSLAKERGLFTVLNPAPAVKEAKVLVRDADLITPNRNELALLSGKEGLDEGIDELLERGASRVIVTLGGEGSYYADRETRFSVPAISAGKAIDTTAAGDTFCGALCVKLAEGATMKEAMRFASACSGIAVTRRGAQASVPTRPEAESLLAKF